jgi:Response regulator containing CheY-like receiver, AAA-type ATPase, and DNA-binding domains
MAIDPRASVIEMIKQHYHSDSGLTDLLCRFLQVAMGATQSAQGEICLKDFEPPLGRHTEGVLIEDDGRCQSARPLLVEECPVRRLFLEHDEKEPLVTKDLTSEAHCARWTLSSGASMAIPLHYQGTTLGVLALAAEETSHYTAAHIEACEGIASELAYHLKRYEINETVKVAFGKELMLVGTSDALRRVDEFIERASSAHLPALIIGEFGSEKRHIAYALHFGVRRDYPFVEVQCATLDPDTLKHTLSSQLRRANGGTIFFNGIDELEYTLQCRLSDVIESEIGGWTSRTEQSESVEVRLVASVSKEVDEQAEEQEFCRPLLEKFDFLQAQIAPLRNRREDIRPLIEYFLSKHSRPPHRSFSDEVLEAFESYDWPGNLYELERVVARLSVMSGEEEIKMPDIYEYAPKLAQQHRESGKTSGHASQPSWDSAKENELNKTSPIAMHVMHIAQGLIKSDFTGIRKFHPGLQSALEYVARNLHEVVTLHEMAQHVGVSGSHLAYLFQKTLGVNFKLFLALVRIEEAKQLLVEKPHMRITEISLDVGFGDLRHFERAFKRLVGQTPREYRQAVLGLQETADSS